MGNIAVRRCGKDALTIFHIYRAFTCEGGNENMGLMFVESEIPCDHRRKSLGGCLIRLHPSLLLLVRQDELGKLP